MNYFSRVREDGKFDVLEGTPDEPGRIVTCFDTQEDAAAYIAEQSAIFDELFDRIVNLEDNIPAEEVVAAGEEATMSTDETPTVGDAGPEIIMAQSDGAVTNYVLKTTTSTGTTDYTLKTVQAHAEPAAPPADFFTDPELSKLERYVTVTDDGRIFGHYAGPEDCHIGYMDACVPAPLTADSLTHWTVGTVKTADGSAVPTGPLALRYGHAETAGISVKDAKAHYDDPDSGIADIVVGLDDHGGWFSGAIRPGVSPDDVRKVLASGVSGDWRFIDGELRLIGICSVNRPGFTKVQVAASADGQIEALVAAGGAPLPHPDLCDCKDSTTDILEELDYLHKIVADAGLEDAAIEKLAARILTDDDIDTLYERIIAT